MKVQRKQVSIYLSNQAIEMVNELRDTLDVESNSRLIEMLLEEKNAELEKYYKLFAKHKLYEYFTGTNQVLKKGEKANECAQVQEHVARNSERSI